MPTLLLRLVGPMQSWGTTSRFDQRDTGKEPSKSGVVGLLAAAMGIDREHWTDLEPLTRLRMSVRHDRLAMPKHDYQTAGCASEDAIIKADGKPSKDGVVSRRHYLADAAFLVGLEGNDRSLLEGAHAASTKPRLAVVLGTEVLCTVRTHLDREWRTRCTAARGLDPVALDRNTAEMGEATREAVAFLGI